MARKNSTVSNAPTVNRPTAAEMKEYYSVTSEERFAKAAEALKRLTNINKTSTQTVTAYNKERLRSFLTNIGSNEKNLRSLSRYLYYRCQAYYRLIMYNANMFELGARTVIPNYNLTKANNDKKILKSYNDTLDVLSKMNLQYEMLKVYITCFIEEIFYGVVYYDDTGMFILPMDADYCKIAGVYQTGDFSYAINMSYFDRNSDLLELWGEPFTSMYAAYKSDQTNGKWQIVPDQYAICMKARPENWKLIVPVFSGLLNSIINLIDIEDVQAIADKQDIYKMLWLELETMPNTQRVDDWKVNPDLVIDYFNRMINEALPDYISAAIIPGKLNSISFGETDKAKETNKISETTKALFNSSGGAQILNSSTISGTEAFRAAIISDTEFAISALLPQTQSWVNRFLGYQVSSPSKVVFFPISAYTKNDFKESLRKDAEYGMPVKLALNTLNGYSEKDTIAMNYLEETLLKITNKFVPLQSSHTQSGDLKKDATAAVDTSTPEETQKVE